MSIKNINVEKKENTIEVHVELNERNDRKGFPKMRFDTSNVLEYLKQKGISFNQCEQEHVLKNWHPDLLNGTWVFSKKTVAATKPKPKARRTRTSKKKLTEE